VGAPVTATVDEPVQDALDRMLHHDFSQLPVVKGNGQQRQFYFITYKSILLALHTFGSKVADSGLRVEDALVKVPSVYRATDDLFELLEVMREMNAALIVDDDQSLTHIVTDYDTTRYFREWAEDIMQVRDVERSLKRIINSSFRKPGGEIDEASRQAAIEEMISANRVLRKKFAAAVKHYTTRQAASAVVLKPEWLDVAFAELLKECKAEATENPTVPEGHESEGGASPVAVISEESAAARLFGSQPSASGEV
jgi:CBS domain-containing protein